MFRMIRTAGLVVLSSAGLVAGAEWRLGTPLLINSNGYSPSLWAGTIAYIEGNGGATMFYNGTESVHVYGPALHSYEPANANGSVAWRNSQVSASSNEIFRWDGTSVTNVSNTPDILDSDLAAGGNGDLIWSQNHTWLMYYDASSGTTTPLNIRGVHPSLYIAEGDVTTYAYQDPDTNEIKYFDGTTTTILGTGAASGAYPSLWNGAVAWIGEGVGSDEFAKRELFFWKEGQTQRVTNDDAVNGVSDDYPSVWNDMVVWSRNGPWAPRLFLWDGVVTTQLTTTTGKFPSLHAQQIAWEGAGGLYLADLLWIADGDCNEDGKVDLIDYADFEGCLLGPTSAVTPECTCFDLDASGYVDLADFAKFQPVFTGP